jgi:hypothetical protein
VDFHPDRIAEMERRLLGIEKQNRRLKQFGAAVLLAIGSLVLMGQARSKKIVEANEFVLLGDDGEVRAKLWTNGDDGRFDFLDKGGRIRLELEAGNFQSNLRLMDNSGQLPSIRLSSSSDGTAELKFSDGKGRDRLIMSLFPLVGTSLLLSDEEGRTNAVLHAPSRGSAFLRLEKAFFSQDAVYLSDAQGFAAQLGVSELAVPRTGETQKTSAASLVLFDKDKNVIWKAP